MKRFSAFIPIINLKNTEQFMIFKSIKSKVYIKKKTAMTEIDVYIIGSNYEFLVLLIWVFY